MRSNHGGNSCSCTQGRVGFWCLSLDKHQHVVTMTIDMIRMEDRTIILYHLSPIMQVIFHLAMIKR